MDIQPYVRVSTLEQAEEGVSLEAQERRIRTWCEAQEVPLEAMYIDAGLSGGRADNRPELQLALATCKRGDVLVFYSLSRLSRSTRDVLAILDQLHRHGADIVSLSEKLDTSSAAGKLTFHMMAIIGEFEMDIISERTRMAMLHLQRQGRYTGGFRPTGWEVGSDGHLQANPEEQRLVARAQQLRGSLASRQTAANDSVFGPNRRNFRRWRLTPLRSASSRTRSMVSVIILKLL